MSNPKYLTQVEVAAFFAAIPRAKVRDRLLFGFIYRYGMRVSEACSLPTSAVNRSLGDVQIQGLKDGHLRRYPIFQDLARLMRRYHPGRQFFFEGRQGRLGRTWVLCLFHTYAEQAGIPMGYGVRSLRHSAAV